MKYENRVTEMTMIPTGEPLFCERATKFRIDDEAAGSEFLVISQCHDQIKPGEITIDADEWLMMRDVIDSMVAKLRKEEAE
jgi:hypothetical protein